MYRSICDMFEVEILIINTWNEMNTSRKTMEWLMCLFNILVQSIWMVHRHSAEISPHGCEFGPE